MKNRLAKRDRYKTGEKALTRKEFDKVMETVDVFEDEVMLLLAVSTGIRREDIGHSPKKNTGIRIEDIKELEGGNWELSFFEHKKNRIWTVPLNEKMMRKIKQLINSRGKQQSEFLISYSGRTCHRRLQEYCKKAGVEPRPFHALRATCIKFCQAAGWSAEQVSRLTGDTIAVIQEHYSTPSTSEMNEVTRDKPII